MIFLRWFVEFWDSLVTFFFLQVSKITHAYFCNLREPGYYSPAIHLIITSDLIDTLLHILLPAVQNLRSKGATKKGHASSVPILVLHSKAYKYQCKKNAKTSQIQQIKN